MKVWIKIIFIVFVTSSVCYGQRELPPRAMERIHAAKMAYITDKLQLTVEQSGAFIPLYNQYEKEIKATRQDFRQKYKNTDMDMVIK